MTLKKQRIPVAIGQVYIDKHKARQGRLVKVLAIHEQADPTHRKSYARVGELGAHGDIIGGSEIALTTLQRPKYFELREEGTHLTDVIAAASLPPSLPEQS